MVNWSSFVVSRFNSPAIIRQPFSFNETWISCLKPGEMEFLNSMQRFHEWIERFFPVMEQSSTRLVDEGNWVNFSSACCLAR